MGRNIVICCDGTANEFAKGQYQCCKAIFNAGTPPRQTGYLLHPGVGTMEPVSELSPARRRIARALGLAIGYGLENDIRDAYVFLMRTYQPSDQVFLF